ncbi:hypothetical protein [Microbacterium gallinarum]|uniref:Uncharacterized protein n=1 Tax=Microbacterium gallinarum TaxID=2762209 RepID=A0ABR8X4W9_9MICO|nr:hypothetical protein [Microbacterium gallinarum]MBD8023871.1 hypothetical protein [Microbacterium gallinarum]
MVELIVYGAVSALFLGLLASMFISGLRAQQQSIARDSAAGRANVFSATLASSIRNATDFRVTGGTRLDASVFLPDGTLECRAWAAVNGAGGAKDIVYRTSTSGAVPAADSTWATVATDVSGTLAGAAVFADDGERRLRVGVTITVGDVVVALTEGITAQAVGEGELRCWP